jgi:uncharacterized Tic20 family protein
MNENTPIDPMSAPSEGNHSPTDTPPPTPAAGGGNMEARQMAMFLHLSQLAGVVVPGLGLAAPIVIWQMKKEQFPELDTHGKMVTNWIISLLIYFVVASILSVVTCGFGALLFIPIAIVAIVYPIIGGLKARDGVLWKYPLTITFIK